MSATFQPDGAPPAKSTSTTKVILIVLGVILLLGILACAGVVGLGVLGFSKIQEVAGQEFKNQLAGNPVIEQEIGEIQTMSLNFTETGNRSNQNPGSQTMVFDVEGTKASGTLIAKVAGNQIVGATLELEDGRSVEVPLEGSIDIDAGDEPMIDAGDEPVVIETVDDTQPVTE